MKTALSLIAVLLSLAGIQHAQSRPIIEAEYNGVTAFAVSETNRAFPFIFKVKTEFFENGKLSSTVTDIAERVASGKERETRITVTGGKTTTEYQLQLDFGKNFCSTDGVIWKATQYECFGPVSFYGPRSPNSVEYSVEERTVDGQKVKVYRKYTTFTPLSPGKPKDFRERLATVDSRGFFLQIVDTEGTLDPRIVRLVRTQRWEMNAKIKPIVAPVE